MKTILRTFGGLFEILHCPKLTFRPPNACLFPPPPPSRLARTADLQPKRQRDLEGGCGEAQAANGLRQGGNRRSFLSFRLAAGPPSFIVTFKPRQRAGGRLASADHTAAPPIEYAGRLWIPASIPCALSPPPQPLPLPLRSATAQLVYCDGTVVLTTTTSINLRLWRAPSAGN